MHARIGDTVEILRGTLYTARAFPRADIRPHFGGSRILHTNVVLDSIVAHKRKTKSSDRLFLAAIKRSCKAAEAAIERSCKAAEVDLI